MKVYGPDITKRGDHIVTIFTEEKNNKEKILMEFHTDNVLYADVYFKAVGNVINDIGGIYTTHLPLKWRIQTMPKPNYWSNQKYLLPPSRKKHPWSHIKISEYRKCPLKYKKDLVPYVAKAMKWSKSRTNLKKKWELQQIWAYKNPKNKEKQ